MDTRHLHGILRFMNEAERLKNTLRYAFTSAGRRESAAEHSWRLALLCMVCADAFPEASPEKLLKLALIHDLGEAVCGDVPAPLQTGSASRAANEREAVRLMGASLPEKMRQELEALHGEYDAGATPEARIVKALDKLETLMQHNSGRNPADFDYPFNLTYARPHTDAHPLAAALRELVDNDTRERLNASRRAP